MIVPSSVACDRDLDALRMHHTHSHPHWLERSTCLLLSVAAPSAFEDLYMTHASGWIARAERHHSAVINA